MCCKTLKQREKSTKNNPFKLLHLEKAHTYKLMPVSASSKYSVSLFQFWWKPLPFPFAECGKLHFYKPLKTSFKKSASSSQWNPWKILCWCKVGAIHESFFHCCCLISDQRGVPCAALAATECLPRLLEAQGPRALNLGHGCSSCTSENWLLVHKSWTSCCWRCKTICHPRLPFSKPFYVELKCLVFWEKCKRVPGRHLLHWICHFHFLLILRLP